MIVLVPDHCISSFLSFNENKSAIFNSEID